MEDLDSDEIDSCLERFKIQDAEREGFLKVAILFTHSYPTLY